MKWSQVKKVLENMTEEQLDKAALTFDDNEGRLVEFVGWDTDYGALALQQDVKWFEAAPSEITPVDKPKTPE